MPACMFGVEKYVYLFCTMLGDGIPLVWLLLISEYCVAFKKGSLGDVEQTVKVGRGDVHASRIEPRCEVPTTFRFGEQMSQQPKSLALFWLVLKLETIPIL